MNRIVEPQKRVARAVGILILGGYLAYGLGSSIVTAELGSSNAAAGPDFIAGAADSATITMGALMMLVNSALVIAVGVLLFPVLRPFSPRVALGYFGTRVFEGILMALGIVSVLTLATIGAASGAPTALDASQLEPLATLLVANNLMAYNVAMAGLGIGSLFLCHLLFTSGLGIALPRGLGLRRLRDPCCRMRTGAPRLHRCRAVGNHSWRSLGSVLRRLADRQGLQPPRGG